MKKTKLLIITNTFMWLPDDFKGNAIDALKLLVVELEKDPESLMWSGESSGDYNDDFQEFLDKDSDTSISYGIADAVYDENGNYETLVNLRLTEPEE